MYRDDEAAARIHLTQLEAEHAAVTSQLAGAADEVRGLREEVRLLGEWLKVVGPGGGLPRDQADAWSERAVLFGLLAVCLSPTALFYLQIGIPQLRMLFPVGIVLTLSCGLLAIALSRFSRYRYGRPAMLAIAAGLSGVGIHLLLTFMMWVVIR